MTDYDVYGKIANQIHGFTINYCKFILKDNINVLFISRATTARGKYNIWPGLIIRFGDWLGYKNLVLSNEHCERFRKLTFRALALRQTSEKG